MGAYKEVRVRAMKRLIINTRFKNNYVGKNLNMPNFRSTTVPIDKTDKM